MSLDYVGILMWSLAIFVDSLFFLCHFGGGENFEIGDWRVCDDSRFFTPLRCVQNDGIEMAEFRMTERRWLSSKWQYGDGCVQSDRMEADACTMTAWGWLRGLMLDPL